MTHADTHISPPPMSPEEEEEREKKGVCAWIEKKVYIHRVYEFQYPVHKTEPTREVFCQHITIVVGEFM